MGHTCDQVYSLHTGESRREGSTLTPYIGEDKGVERQYFRGTHTPVEAEGKSARPYL